MAKQLSINHYFLRTFLFLLAPVIIFPQSQLGGDIDGEASNDRSGWSVSISSDGMKVAVGANFNDDNGSNSGHVRVFELTGENWTQLGSDIDGEAAGDGSGYAVSLSSDGTTVAVGAHLNDGNGNESGHVRVYNWSGSSWSQLGDDIDGEAEGDHSGYSVSLSSDGTTIAVGADQNDGNGEMSGHVRVYNLTEGSWTQLGNDLDGESSGDFSGESVSLSSDGSVVAIGAHGNDSNGNESGHVRVYNYSGGIWTQLGGDIEGETTGSYSGNAVSLSSDGTIVAIGARFNFDNGSNSGHVRVYNYIEGSWAQLGDDIDGEETEDYSGCSVSLSSDGNRVAIGAYGSNDNGSNSGHVRIFKLTGEAWSQLGSDIGGEAAYDQSGYAVSVSSDGRKIAVGAHLNDGNGTNSGQIRVYLFPTAPTGLVAASHNQQITLRWNQSSDTNIVKYIIYGGTTTHPITKVDSTTSISDTTKTFLGLLNNTTYYYRVTAVNDEGYESTYSDEVSAVPHGQAYSVKTDGSGDYTEIQAAIDAIADGDSLLVHPGAYIENINYNGRKIVMGSLYLTTGDTSFISSTIIDGNQNGSVVTFENSEDSTAQLIGLTITNGSSAFGGGIHCNNSSSPRLTNLQITYNTADSAGGGIYCFESSPDIVEGIVSENASERGSGLYCSGSSPSLTHMTISGNTASDSTSGVVYFENSSPTILNTIIWGNTPEEILVEGGSVVVSFSDIEGGWEGEGNISALPLFCNPGTSGDYTLAENSPCAGSGENGANMGAYGVGCDARLSLENELFPTSFMLNQNYPNPFNPVTTIHYELPQRADVQITIYDLLGRKVTTLLSETQDAGYKSIAWNAINDKGKPVSAGVYLYQIQAGEFVQTKKMVLLK